MKIFRSDGHLRQEALYALVQNQPLEELERLEIAEHLAFCDLCLQRYTDALTKEPLLLPQRSCRDTIWRRIRSRTMRLLTSRYATAAAAVALALTLLWSDHPVPKFITAERPMLEERIDNWAERWSNSIGGIMEHFNHFFEGHSGPDNGGNTQ